MNEEKKLLEESTVEETTTEYDAVHPRFAKENPDEVLKYEQEHYFYCSQCKLYFSPTTEGLGTHFDREIITHKPYGSCFYCTGKVYEYSIHNQPKVYHNCMNKSKNK